MECVAVAFEAFKPLAVTTVQLEGPRAGEVWSRSRPPLCHTDSHIVGGRSRRPCSRDLGHECAGIVVASAPASPRQEGRPVIPFTHPSAGNAVVHSARQSPHRNPLRRVGRDPTLVAFSLDAKNPPLHWHIPSPRSRYCRDRDRGKSLGAPSQGLLLGCGVTTGIGPCSTPPGSYPFANASSSVSAASASRDPCLRLAAPT